MNHISIPKQKSLDRTKTSCIIHVEKQYIECIISYLLNQQIPFSVNIIEEDLNNARNLSDLNYFNSKEENPIYNNGFDEMHINELIRESLDKNTIISLPVVAGQFGMSKLNFNINFKRQFGRTFYEYYLEKRMQHAAYFLKQGYTALKVSQLVGYGDKSSIKFNKMFQKYFGMTPKKYQLNNRVYLNDLAKKRYEKKGIM